MRFITKIMLALWATLSLIQTAGAAEGNVGITQLETKGEFVVPLTIWYPAVEPTVDWQAGPYTIHATRNATITPGSHPLILISHGSGGGDMGHADLAEALARRGYIVVAPRHLGDSYDQPEGFGSDMQMIGRPAQSVAALDTVLTDPHLKPAIDPTRIGMAGFSAGGYTTLVMSGARPNFALHGAYCKAHPDDKNLCWDGATTRMRITRPGWQVPSDHRVRAAVAMAPFSVMFDAGSVKNVHIPLLIYKADDDQVLRNQWNTDHVLSLLPRDTEHGTLAGGHYVFLAPCGKEMLERTPEICVDRAGVDRLALHTKLNNEIVDFFDRKLK